MRGPALAAALGLLALGRVAGAQDYATPAPAGPQGGPLALLEGAPPAAPARFAIAGATTRWFGLPDLVTRATALAAAWHGAVAAAGLSQTGDPEQGWTAFGLVLGGAGSTAGGSIRAVARRDRAPDPPLGPLGRGVGLEAGAAAWVAAGGGIALWASAPQMRVRGAAPPLRRGLEIGGRWRAAGGGLWLAVTLAARRSAPVRAVPRRPGSPGRRPTRWVSDSRPARARPGRGRAMVRCGAGSGSWHAPAW